MSIVTCLCGTASSNGSVGVEGSINNNKMAGCDFQQLLQADANSMVNTETVTKELDLIAIGIVPNSKSIVQFMEKLGAIVDNCENEAKANELLDTVLGFIDDFLTNAETNEICISQDVKITDEIEQHMDDILASILGVTSQTVSPMLANMQGSGQGNVFHDGSVQLNDNGFFVNECTVEKSEIGIGDIANKTSDVAKKLSDIFSNIASDGKDTVNSDILKKEDISHLLDKLNIEVGSQTETAAISLEKDSTRPINPMIKQIIESIQNQVNALDLQGKTLEIRLNLFPSKLGHILIVAEKDSDSLKLKVVTSSPEVKSIISESLGTLKSELSSSFSGGVSVDVSSRDNGEPRGEGNNSSAQSKDEEITYVRNKGNLEIDLINKILDITI